MRTLPLLLLMTALVLSTWGGCLVGSRAVPSLSLPPSFGRFPAAIAAFVLLLWAGYVIHGGAASPRGELLRLASSKLPFRESELRAAFVALGTGLALLALLWLRSALFGAP